MRSIRMKRTMTSTLAACVVALGAVAISFAASACSGAAKSPADDPGATSAPATSPQDGEPSGVATDAPGGDGAGAAPPTEGPSSAPGEAVDDPANCKFGAIEDPHSGFVRCRREGEGGASAVMRTEAVDGGAPAAPADAGAAPATPAPITPGPKPVVEWGEPTFENGKVPTAARSLERVSQKIAECVADAGGLTAKTGSLKVQFLVRARGKAEGVEVSGATGLPAAATGCIRLAIKNKSVGTPSAEPVGVTLTITFKAAK